MHHTAAATLQTRTRGSKKVAIGPVFLSSSLSYVTFSGSASSSSGGNSVSSANSVPRSGGPMLTCDARRRHVKSPCLMTESCGTGSHAVGSKPKAHHCRHSQRIQNHFCSFKCPSHQVQLDAGIPQLGQHLPLQVPGQLLAEIAACMPHANTCQATQQHHDTQ